MSFACPVTNANARDPVPDPFAPTVVLYYPVSDFFGTDFSVTIGTGADGFYRRTLWAASLKNGHPLPDTLISRHASLEHVVSHALVLEFHRRNFDHF